MSYRNHEILLTRQFYLFCINQLKNSRLYDRFFQEENLLNHLIRRTLLYQFVERNRDVSEHVQKISSKVFKTFCAWQRGILKSFIFDVSQNCFVIYCLHTYSFQFLCVMLIYVLHDFNFNDFENVIWKTWQRSYDAYRN